MCDDLFMSKKHDPGGKVRIALTLDTTSKAVFGGPGDCYRYRLSRTWDEKKPHALFVMMNPSTADTVANDPTVANAAGLHAHGDMVAYMLAILSLTGRPTRSTCAWLLTPLARTTTSTLLPWQRFHRSWSSLMGNQVTAHWLRVELL
jgi:Protein of unknown function (DUF1643)